MPGALCVFDFGYICSVGGFEAGGYDECPDSRTTSVMREGKRQRKGPLKSYDGVRGAGYILLLEQPRAS